VAAALARPLAVPVDLVRLAFVVLTFVHFLGPILYGALWLVVPPAPGETSLLERGLARAWALAAHLRGAPPGTRGPRPTGGGGAPNLPGEARSC
jgi:phage shock protein PspC (stress-responsive transcriptional regulator)